MSDQKVLNIYQKLQGARVSLQSKELKKSGENKFANFKYYELADFLPSVNAMFNEIGLFSQFNITGDASFGTAKLLIVNSDNPKEELTFESPIAEANVKGTTPVQSLGAIHTYLKRYLYVNALEIVEADGLDAVVGSDKIIDKQKAIKKDSKASEVRTTELETILYGTQYTLTDVNEWLVKNQEAGKSITADLGTLTNSEFAQFKNALLTKLDKERKVRIAQGNDTPYDHANTKLQ